MQINLEEFSFYIYEFFLILDFLRSEILCLYSIVFDTYYCIILRSIEILYLKLHHKLFTKDRFNKRFLGYTK